MRIAFFIQGTSVPSSRFRVLQYIPKLLEKGFRCDVYSPAVSPQGVSSFIFPGTLYHVARHLSQLIFYVPARFCQILMAQIGSYDIVFIQKPLMDWPVSAMLEKIIFQKNRNIIFDIDDAVFAAVTGESNKKFKQVKEIASLSKVIIAGNQYLAEKTGVLEGNVMVLPTTVDEKVFRPRQREKRDVEVCIGWTGTSSNLRYLLQILPVFERLNEMKNIKIKIISDRRTIKELSHLRNAEISIWKPETEVEDLQDFDIGLMPLEDNQWTRGKCSFKLIQYMAIGIPAIASPVGVNREVLCEGVTGYFAESLEGWVNAVKRLAEDSALRGSMGTEARFRFLAKYSLSRNMEILEATLRDVSGNVPETLAKNELGRSSL